MFSRNVIYIYSICSWALIGHESTFFSCEVDFTAGLPSMEYLGFSTKTMIVTQIYGTSNCEDDENPLERGSFPVSFHVFPGKLSRREQRGSAAAEAGFQ
jgi:hypothetical protein